MSDRCRLIRDYLFRPSAVHSPLPHLPESNIEIQRAPQQVFPIALYIYWYKFRPNERENLLHSHEIARRLMFFSFVFCIVVSSVYDATATAIILLCNFYAKLRANNNFALALWVVGPPYLLTLWNSNTVYMITDPSPRRRQNLALIWILSNSILFEVIFQ